MADTDRQGLEVGGVEQVKFLSLWKGEILVTIRTTMREIAEDVCERRGILMRELMGRSRTYRIAHARQEAMYLMRQLGKSYPKIGGFFDMDHTNIIHGVKRHGERLSV